MAKKARSNYIFHLSYLDYLPSSTVYDDVQNGREMGKS